MMNKKIFFAIIATLSFLKIHAQQFNNLLGESNGKEVHLFWYVLKIDAATTGFDIKRKTAAGEWVTLNKSEIFPEQRIAKDLSNVETDVKHLNELSKKLSAKFTEGNLHELKREEYLQKLKTDTSAMIKLAIFFATDYEMALLNGFAFIDRTQMMGENYTYGLFFHTTAGSQKEPAAIWNCKGGVPTFTKVFPSVKFNPNKNKTSVNVEFSIPSKTLTYAGFAGFNIYKKSGNKTTKINSSPIWMNRKNELSSSFILDENVSKDSLYIYSLEPLTAFGFTGEKTEKLYDPKKFAGEITAPKISQSDNGADASGLELKWNFNKESESFIKGFIIERKENIDSQYIAVSPVLPASSRTFKDTKNLRFQYYYFYRIRIETTDEIFEKINSNEILVYYQPSLKPSVPKNISANYITENGKKYIHIKWKNNEDGITKGYKIYASFPPSKTLSWQADIPLISGNEIKYEIYNADSQEYYFSVSAISRFEDESVLGETVKVNTPASVLPNIEIWPFRVDSNQITLEWKYNSILNLKGFRIYSDGKIVADIDTLNAETRKFILHNLKYNTEYNFEMEAIDNFGTISKKSLPLNIRTFQKK